MDVGEAASAKHDVRGGASQAAGLLHLPLQGLQDRQVSIVLHHMNSFFLRESGPEAHGYNEFMNNCRSSYLVPDDFFGAENFLSRTASFARIVANKRSGDSCDKGLGRRRAGILYSLRGR